MGQSRFPTFGRLDRVRRAHHQHVGHGPQRRQNFNRLVCGAVFADADRVVAEHEFHGQAHQCGHAHGGALVVGKSQIGHRQRQHTAMRGHAVGHGAHDMFAHTAMHIGALAVGGREGRQAPFVAGRCFQIRAAHHALGQPRCQQVVDFGRDEDAAGRRGGVQCVLFVVQQDLWPVGEQFPAHHALKFSALGRRQRGHP